MDAGKSSGSEPCHSQKVNMAASYYINYNVRIESPISASQHTPVPNHGYPDLEDPSLQGHTPSSTACWTSNLKLLTQLYAETNHKTEWSTAVSPPVVFPVWPSFGLLVASKLYPVSEDPSVLTTRKPLHSWDMFLSLKSPPQTP